MNRTSSRARQGSTSVGLVVLLLLTAFGLWGNAVTAGVVVTVPGCAVAPADVVGWWRAEQNLAAAIGPALTGSATYEPGLIGDAIRFSGANTLGVAGFPTLTTGVSIDMWIRPAKTGLPQVLASRWQLPATDDVSTAFALILIGDDLVWLTDEQSTLRPQELRVTTTNLYDGDFHHVAATWGQSEMAIYVNGWPAASRPSQGGTLNAATSTEFRLGSKYGIGDPLRFSGVIDEPAVYRRALTAAEVDSIVAAGPGGKCTAVDGVAGPGLQFEADSGGVDPVMSATGRYLLFRSRATDLFPVVTDPLQQTPGVDLDMFEDARDDLVLVDTKNTTTTSDDTTELINVDSNELGGALDANGGAITPSGSHVAFSSISNDLVTGDTLAGRDVFVRNRSTGTTERVSVRSDGSQPEYSATGLNNDSRAPSISDAGNVVAFESTNRGLVPEANPVPGDTWQTYDIYVRDTSASDPLNWFTERITVGLGDTKADGSSSTPIVSPDGRYVWFSSSASNLVVDDTNGRMDMFRYDRQTDTVVRVNVTGATGLALNDDVWIADVSSNGRYVAFSSNATTIVAGDDNGLFDAFLIDTQAPVATAVAKMSPAGTGEGNAAAFARQVSDSGRYVMFESGATNLVADDTNGRTDVFVADRTLATVQRVSVDAGGQQRDGGSSGAAASSSLNSFAYMFQRPGEGLITIWRSRLQLA